MKITSVHFGKTYNIGNFENERYDATSDVETGQTPEQVMAALHAWCDGQRGLSMEYAMTRHALDEMQERLARARRTLSALERQRVVWVTHLKESGAALPSHVEFPFIYPDEEAEHATTEGTDATGQASV